LLRGFQLFLLTITQQLSTFMFIYLPQKLQSLVFYTRGCWH
jgi:hypothetical protein